jgi:hypothetical protein
MAPVFIPAGASECQPLRTLEEVLNWQKPNYERPLEIASRSRPVSGKWKNFSNLRPTTAAESAATPKTLLCHDFRGGYHEDRFVDGCDSSAFPYLFTHWSLIDTFVYFSHHLVTVPPPGWIAAAHRNRHAPPNALTLTQFAPGEKMLGNCSDAICRNATCDRKDTLANVPLRN